MKLKVTVTKAHVKRARELMKDTWFDSRCSCCCPATLAIYDALGRPFDPQRVKDGDHAFIWSSGSCVGIDGKEYDTPEDAAHFIDWFDGHAVVPPLLPFTFTLEDAP